MMMVHATVFLLLALVGSVILIQAMANSMYVFDDDQSISGVIPTCQANYAVMDPKLLIDNPGPDTISWCLH